MTDQPAGLSSHSTLSVLILRNSFPTQSPSGVLLRAAIESHRAFEIAHAVEKQVYIEDHSRALFPVGTYGYREQLRVRVAKGGRAA